MLAGVDQAGVAHGELETMTLQGWASIGSYHACAATDGVRCSLRPILCGTATTKHLGALGCSGDRSMLSRLILMLDERKRGSPTLATGCEDLLDSVAPNTGGSALFEAGFIPRQGWSPCVSAWRWADRRFRAETER